MCQYEEIQSSVGHEMLSTFSNDKCNFTNFESFIPSPFSVTVVYNVNPYVLGVLCALVSSVYLGMVHVCQDHTVFTTQPVHFLQHAYPHSHDRLSSFNCEMVLIVILFIHRVIHD